MQPNYARWGGVEAFQRGIPLYDYILGKMGKT